MDTEKTPTNENTGSENQTPKDPPTETQTPNETPKQDEQLKKEISSLSAKLDKVLSLLSQPVKTEENPKVEEETPMDKVETVEEIQNLLDI